MTREEFKLIVKLLKAIYAEPTFIADQDAFDAWYLILRDIPFKLARMATQKYIESKSSAPKPADIRAMAAKIAEPEQNQMSELSAWQLVYKAICNSNYNAESEFAKLPPICQKAVGTPHMLKEWASMDIDTVQSVEQSHFIRNYRAELERNREEAKTSLSLQSDVNDYRIANARNLAERMIGTRTEEERYGA